MLEADSPCVTEDVGVAVGEPVSVFVLDVDEDANSESVGVGVVVGDAVKVAVLVSDG